MRARERVCGLRKSEGQRCGSRGENEQAAGERENIKLGRESIRY